DHNENAYVDRLIGHVSGRNALIVDDFTITGGTLIATAERLKLEGARDIYAAVAHGVFARTSSAKIDASPIRELIMTDTIEHRFEKLPKKVRVVSAAPLFAKAIRSIHRQTSVSALFGNSR